MFYFSNINQKSLDPDVLFRDFMYLSYFLNHHNFCQQRGSRKKETDNILLFGKIEEKFKVKIKLDG